MQPVLTTDDNGNVITYQGKVQWFDSKKGYGFISCPAASNRGVFVHWSKIISEGFKKLREGDEVEFNRELDNVHGLIAVNVKVTKKGPKKKKEEKHEQNS